MNCPTKRNEDAEILLDYCAQTLSPMQTAEFESHLNECADCSRLVAAQKEVCASLESWTPIPVSGDFDARLYARIAEENAAPSWKQWFGRILHPPIPYAWWKSAIPLTAACAVLGVALFVHMPDAKTTAQPQLHAAGQVDILKVEQELEDVDILTPATQAPAGSM